MKLTFLEKHCHPSLWVGWQWFFSRMSISTVILSNMHYLYNDNLQLSSTQLHLLPTSKIYCSHFFFTNVINKLPDYKTLISLALIRNRELHKERFIILKPCLNHVFVPVKTMYIASSVNFERINDFDLTYFHCMFLYKNNVNITFNYP